MKHILLFGALALSACGASDPWSNMTPEQRAHNQAAIEAESKARAARWAAKSPQQQQREIAEWKRANGNPGFRPLERGLPPVQRVQVQHTYRSCPQFSPYC